MTLRITTAPQLLLMLATACAGMPEPPPPDRGADGVEPFDPGFTTLATNATVDDAVDEACSTAAVIGLSEELVAELDCIEPGLMDGIRAIEGVELGGAAMPYLQTPVAEALSAAAADTTAESIMLNSTIRTLPQQFMLYRWRELGLCGQTNPVARPGSSNHHSGIAIDVQNWSDVKADLVGAGFVWYGESDAVHFTYTEGVQDVRSNAVLAFQRLWNQAHPDEPLEEDGDWGPLTQSALERAPAAGFGLRSTCDYYP